MWEELVHRSNAQKRSKDKTRQKTYGGKELPERVE